MSSKPTTVAVRLLDNDYRLACAEENRPALLEAARHLDDKMREIRRSGRTLGMERIAVMAALVVTHELLASRQGSDSLNANIEARLEQALDAVETTLRKCSEIAV